MKPCQRMIPALAILCLVVVASRAGACAIPVFRYALERWHPDNYLVVVLHRGPLSELERGLVAKLEAAGSDTDHPANLEVTTLDVPDQASVAVEGEDGGPTPESGQVDRTGPGSGQARLLEMLRQHTEILQQQTLESAHMVVLLPIPGLEPWQMWTGPLTERNVARLIDSPARRAIVEKLLAGDSAVWVLILSGDKQKDQRAEATLERELERIEKLLQLPAQEVLEAEQAFRPDTPVELRVGFSIVTLPPDDPDEEIFRAVLLASEPDLAEFKEPIAVPIFGRGRTCFALVGEGIHADTIEENCRFLCDGCSCLIKQQNPGVDMLFAVDWERRVAGSAMPDLVLPELTGVGALAVDDSAAAAAESGVPADTPLTSPEALAKVPADPATATAAAPLAPAGPAVDAADAPMTTTSVPPASSRAARKLLVWTLTGAGVAVLVVLAGSLWMRSR